MPETKVSQRNIAQSFNCLCHLILVPECILLLSQVKKIIIIAHRPSHQHDLKESANHQKRPPSFNASWSSSNAHMPIVDDFRGLQGSARALLPVCGFWAPYTASFDSLCVLTAFYHSQHNLFQQFLLE